MFYLFFIFHILFLLIKNLYGINNENINNLQVCSKEWQNPILTIPTLSLPSIPLKCYPDDRICEKYGGECQFSLKKFEYICCKNNDYERIPLCPRYYDTLHTLCGNNNNEGRCPKSYECMKARNYPNIKLCCRRNDNLSYIEPETTFNDHFIVPDIIPYAPKHSINIIFNEDVLTEGQLIYREQINDLLDRPPQLSGYVFSDNLQYTVIIIGFPFRFTKNTSIDNPSTVYLFENDIKPINGKIKLQDFNEIENTKQNLYIKKNLKEIENSFKFSKCCTVSYKKPGDEIKSKEIYTMLLLIFKQKKSFTISQQNLILKKNGKDKILNRNDIILPNQEPFYMKKFLKQNNEIYDTVPVVGNFYGIKG
ncbi:Hypothetical protein SRAE_X000090600 [Strongyloides ratti]|uniref:Uncharacterized protein n=1 Tax=Strongyloides ratti TaxID=34506 RepID=A0A090LTN4_STRRB|nr:Hypothetical protein SRAE_X000090600 [Strongyloides ratti]CEF71582.1 Hypothetical protein SRAE_X000090600 [Strongyloides ratti]